MPLFRDAWRGTVDSVRRGVCVRGYHDISVRPTRLGRLTHTTMKNNVETRRQEEAFARYSQNGQTGSHRASRCRHLVSTVRAGRAEGSLSVSPIYRSIGRLWIDASPDGPPRPPCRGKRWRRDPYRNTVCKYEERERTGETRGNGETEEVCELAQLTRTIPEKYRTAGIHVNMSAIYPIIFAKIYVYTNATSN